MSNTTAAASESPAMSSPAEKHRERRKKRELRSTVSGNRELKSVSGLFVQVRDWQATWNSYYHTLSGEARVTTKEGYTLLELNVYMWPTDSTRDVIEVRCQVNEAHSMHLSGLNEMLTVNPQIVRSAISGRVRNREGAERNLYYTDDSLAVTVING